MDTNTIVNILIGFAGVSGGFIGGRRIGSDQAVSTALQTVELLQIQTQILTERGETDATEIANLRGRLDVLESMITQRAEVEAVHEDVRIIKNTVERIAGKIERDLPVRAVSTDSRNVVGA